MRSYEVEHLIPRDWNLIAGMQPFSQMMARSIYDGLFSGGAERSWLDNFGRASDAASAQAASNPGQLPPPGSSQPSKLASQAAPGKQRHDAPQAAGNGTPGQTPPKTPPRRKGKKVPLLSTPKTLLLFPERSCCYNHTIVAG